jgi:predicted RNA-binding Zn ribbon-like protein
MHLDVAELPLVGGHPAVDLVNTLERGPSADGSPPHDYLTEPAALLRWAVAVGLVSEFEQDAVATAWRRDPAAGRAALSATRDIREALHTALLAVLGVLPREDAATSAALDRLQSRWAASAARSAFVLIPGDAPAVQLAVGVAPALLLPDRAADAAVDLLRTADLGRLGRCPPDAGGCGWLFLDHSRNGTRRWCRMADCGTQVKARRLTERRRAARAH